MQDYGSDEQAEKGGKDKSAQIWLDKIATHKKDFDKWHDRCEKVAKLYSKSERADSADREYSMFWANIEVLKPATYARPPIPVVAPRFKDSNPVAREASEIVERACVINFEQQDIDGALRLLRDDFLMYARGTAWVRQAGDAVHYDHVFYKDFAHGTARSWREVPWVGRRAWLTRDKGVERFGDDFKRVPLKRKDDKATADAPDDQAPVWEIWCKESGAVYWVAEDYPEILDEQPPLFDVRGFFPCPHPAYGTLVPGTLKPVPEIVQYKDQIEEINEYTARIAALSEALRLKGFYAAGQGDLSEAIEVALKSTDNRAMLVPISSFAALGGSSFKDSIMWLPVADVVSTVQALVELRRVVIEDVYQITGISDIVRGATNASETATAQQIKSQWGSMRIRERQQELQRFARDLTRMTAEIFCENVDPAILMEMAQAQLPNMAQKQQAEMMAQQAAQQQQPLPRELTRLLKQPAREEVAQFIANDRSRGFIIEVETDSTIQPDEDAEKNRRIEFITAVGGMFQQAAPLVMQAPMLGPFVVETIKFAAAGFRAGRSLEQTLDELGEQIEGMATQAAQPKEPVEDPAITLKKAELAMKQEEAQARLQIEQQKMQFEGQKTAAQIELEREKMAAQMSMDREKHDAEIGFKRESEQARLADAREGRNATLKATERPAVNVQTDAKEAMEQAAMALQQMATDQSAALTAQGEMMAQTMAVLTDAVSRLGGPRRKTVMGSKGQQYEITDEAV
jgi:hypothetical protein